MIYALKGAKMHLLWLDVPTSITGGNAIGWRLIINTNKYRFSCCIRGGGWVWIRNRVLRILRWRQREILGYMGAPQPEEEEDRKGAHWAVALLNNKFFCKNMWGNQFQKYSTYSKETNLYCLEELVRPVSPVVSGAARGNGWSVVRAGRNRLCRTRSKNT